MSQPVDSPESELDEMGGYVGKKSNPRWLWHAIDHGSGKVLAYVFDRRKDEVFLQLEAEQHEVSKKNMQKIENKHLNFWTRIKRLARKTNCFSKTVARRDIVIGLLINRYELGMPI